MNNNSTTQLMDVAMRIREMREIMGYSEEKMAELQMQLMDPSLSSNYGKLMEIQEKARNEKCFRDSEWDLQFHVQVALATQNTALAAIVEKMWTQRVHNPYWKKLHEHIDLRTVDNWCDDHDQILKALPRKDPNAAKLAMWQHLENTKQMLFNETSDDFEFNADRYLFADNPVVHLDTAANSAK